MPAAAADARGSSCLREDWRRCPFRRSASVSRRMPTVRSTFTFASRCSCARSRSSKKTGPLGRPCGRRPRRERSPAKMIACRGGTWMGGFDRPGRGSRRSRSFFLDDRFEVGELLFGRAERVDQFGDRRVRRRPRSCPERHAGRPPQSQGERRTQQHAARSRPANR